MYYTLLLAGDSVKNEILTRVWNILTSKFALAVYIGIVFFVVMLFAFRVLNLERKRLSETKQRQRAFDCRT